MKSKKLFFALLIAVLMMASLPAAGILAAPPDPAEENALESAWTGKDEQVQFAVFVLEDLQIKQEDFRNQVEWEKAQKYLNRYRAALKQAQILLAGRAGLDPNGQVMDIDQAVLSVRGLAEQLHIMRQMREKIEELKALQ